MRRLVVTGGECTGKTTLARALADRLGTACVGEGARTYAQALSRPLTADDVHPIFARSQRELARAARAVVAGRHDLLVCDTDLLSTVVYARHYYGWCASGLVDAAAPPPMTTYLLCEPDLPWSPDGVRDQPTQRDRVHQRFAGALQAMDATVVPVRGVGQARMAMAWDGLVRAGVLPAEVLT